MLLDWTFAICMLLALIKGWRKGLIMALFSFFALLLGLAAAIKLSAVTALYLKDTVHISARWLPFVSFLLLFFLVVLAVQLLGKLIEKSADWVMLGWVNKLGGILLYALLYTLLYSILLFYLTQMKLISEEALQNSVAARYLAPWGPAVMDFMGKWIPIFKDMFSSLKEFFGNMAQKLP